MRRPWRAAVLLACVATAAHAGGPIADRLPRIVYRGGPFLRHPRVVTVTFAGDDAALVARLERFGDVIVRTAWWRAAVEGHCAAPCDCIGDGRAGTGVRLDEPLPRAVRAVDVEALLVWHLRAGRFGPPDADGLLLVYLPAGVGLTAATGARYCDGGPRAFHAALRHGRAKVAYAVVPRCGDEAELTATASHEIVEATTNPDPSARGFALVPGSANLGFTAAGPEPVDPCGLLMMGGHRATESGFVVQRVWSNRAASLGRDPCVPSATGRPYVALVPRRPTVRLRAPGERTTVVLDAAADRPTPAWRVSTVELTGEGCVEASLDRAFVAAGETVTLTLTARAPDARRRCVVGLVSTVDGRSSLWPVAVVVR